MARKGSTSKKSSGVGALGFTFLALIFTSATAFFLSQMMDSKKFQSVPMRSAVVAAKDISASDLLEKSYFKVVKLPINHIPKNAFESLEALFPADKINEPRVLINKIYKNEVVLPQRLSDPNQGTGFASLVNQNFRALSLGVDRRVTRANLVYPGAIIDILTTMRRPETRDSITKLVVQGVKVIAVNGITEAAELREEIKNKKSRNGNDVLTILVDPDQGEALTLASREGQVDVLLRNTNDSSLMDTQGVSSTELTKSDIEEESVTAKKSTRRKRKRSRVRRSTQESRSRRRRGKRSTTTIELE